jgi:hypothetical protein
MAVLPSGARTLTSFVCRILLKSEYPALDEKWDHNTNISKEDEATVKYALINFIPFTNCETPRWTSAWNTKDATTHMGGTAKTWNLLIMPAMKPNTRHCIAMYTQPGHNRGGFSRHRSTKAVTPITAHTVPKAGSNNCAFNFA